MKRKATIIMLGAFIALPATGQSMISASTIKAERDQSSAQDSVRFFDTVPAWGEPAQIEAANQAARDVYNQQIMDAEAVNANTRVRALEYQADQADQQSRRYAKKVLGEMGEPSSVYRNGSYESRTYQSGDTVQTIRMEDGKITGSSTYRSNR